MEALKSKKKYYVNKLGHSYFKLIQTRAVVGQIETTMGVPHKYIRINHPHNIELK